MVTNNGDGQSQEVNLSEARSERVHDGGGASSQQNGDSGGEDQSGAGTGPGETKKTARTYSEEEVGKIQSSSDTRVADANKIAGNAVLTLQRERAERQESDARAVDAAEVDNGDLTSEGAKNRAAQRQTDRDDQDRRAKETAETERAYAEAEPVLRHAMVLELAAKYEIDAKTLEDDPKATTPDLMEARAEVLAAEKKVKDLTPAEKFDGGASGVGGTNVSIEDMNGLQKIEYALRRPAPKT